MSLFLAAVQTYANQIKQLEVQYKLLVASGEALAENSFVGSRAVFSQELRDLALQWEPLKDNVMDALEILIRCVGVVWVWCGCVRMATLGTSLRVS